METLWNQMQGAYGAQGQNTGSLYDQLVSQMSNPTYSQGAYAAAAPSLTGPTVSAGFYGANSGYYTTPGAAETTYGVVAPQYGNVNGAANANAAAMSMVGGPNALDQNAGAIASGFNSANHVQQFADRNGSAYNAPGALERFAASDLAGTNPYYQMLQQQGTDALNQQLAARGAYGSGGALGTLAKFTGDLSAQQYQQEGQLQGAAQSAQMQRLAQGGTLAGQESAEAMSRNLALQNLFNQQFQDTNAAANTLIAGGTAADRSKLDALAGLTTAGNDAQSQANARMIAGQNAAAAADSSTVNAATALGALGASSDASLNARNQTLSTAANNADTQGLNALNDMFNQGDKTQQDQETRIRDMQDEYLKSLALQTGLYGLFYGNAGNIENQDLTNAVNANANAGQLQGQGDIARQKMYNDWLKTIANGIFSGAKG